MREIKFREVVDGEMRYFSIGQQVRSGIVGSTDINVMQYTGLKDKNEVEIYEGDIIEVVRFKADTADAKKTTWFKYIKWNDETSAWAVMESPSPYDEYANVVCGYIEEWDGDCGYNLTSREASRMNVLGNIYQNPELLKHDA